MSLATHPTAQHNLRANAAASIRRRLAPPTKLTVSEWADRYRYLSREASAEPGKWRTDRAPYLREIMDAISDPLIEEVVAMMASQVGKTEVILNGIGFYADQDPAPMLVIQPNVEPMAQAFSKDRVDPMVRDTPRLAGRFADRKGRSGDNTILHKVFPGGHLTIVGANAPAGLASRPIRVVFADEVDRYPASAGLEGDPFSLAKRRTSTFWNRKHVSTSSPTLKGLSRIEAEHAIGDQRTYHVPCPNCGTFQPLVWGQLKYEAGRPETARYLCAHCPAEWQEYDKLRLLERGKWVAKFPGRKVASFHLNALYSPWVRWESLVDEWIKCQGVPEKLRVFVNTVLAETYQEDAERVEPTGLMARRVKYEREAPEPVGLLTAGMDVQADRVEALVRGWGAAEESWLVHREVLYGDPTRPQLWADVDRLLKRKWDGLGIAAGCIDSGYQPEHVYRFVGPRQRARIFATKGLSVPGHPIIGRLPKRPNAQGVKLVPIGTEAAKDLLFMRLKQPSGPGAYHWPDWADEEYFAQLTAEHAMTKYSHGRPYRVYEKDPNRRNEALDMEVLCLAALLLLGPTVIQGLGRRAESRMPKVQGPAEPAPIEPLGQQALRKRLQKPSGSWVSGWKR